LSIFPETVRTHFLSPAQKVARVEASTEMLRILHESEENHFEGIATGDEFWLQHSDSYPSLKIFGPLPTDVIPRTRQAIGRKQTMIAIFFTGRKRIVLDILPKGSKFNRLYNSAQNRRARFLMRRPHFQGHKILEMKSEVI
jgi:hypothetical protein